MAEIARRTTKNNNRVMFLIHRKEVLDQAVKTFRNQADLILDGSVNLDYFTDVLKYIHAITNNFEQIPANA